MAVAEVAPEEEQRGGDWVLLDHLHDLLLEQRVLVPTPDVHSTAQDNAGQAQFEFNPLSCPWQCCQRRVI